MAKKSSPKADQLRKMREAAATKDGHGSNGMFDLSAFMTARKELEEKQKNELQELKAAQRQPIADALEKVEADIAELELKRDELQGILDNIDGIETKKRGGRKSSTAKASNLPSFDGEANDVAKVVKDGERYSRGDIAEKLGVAADVKLTTAIGSAVEAKLIKKVAGTTGRGTRYVAA